MLNKIFIFLISLTLFANATTIETNKNTYDAGEQISVTLTDMQNNEDWVGIYPVGANNEWANMVSWAWTEGNNNVNLDGVPAGEYEARAFFNNSFDVEATDAFTVNGAVLNTTIATNKVAYDAGEQISVTLTNMLGNEDWIGIYPVGADNEWDNIVSWAWTEGNINVNLDGIPVGEYEARAFFNNSFDVKATDAFTVNGAVLNTTITTNKETYDAGEQISVTLTNMLENEDWIGIYPVGAANEWGNVISWAFTAGNANVNLAGVAAGDYEVRAFFNNAFDVKATDTFTVNAIQMQPTIYEDGEDGDTVGWQSIGERGQITNVADGYNSNRSINVPVHWGGNIGGPNFRLLSDYTFGDNWNNANQKILKFEHKGRAACFLYGVRVNTLLGARMLTWDAYYTHKNWDPLKEVYENGIVELIFKTPGNVRNEPNWTPHSYNIEEFIQRLEPNNRLLSVQGFYTSGGGKYDNIRLESE